MPRSTVECCLLAFLVLATLASAHTSLKVKKLHTKGKRLPKSLAALTSIPLQGGLLVTGYYAVEVTVGTGAGAMTFDALLDTGSSNTAVPAVGCSSCQGLTTLYNASASPTSKPLMCDDAWCKNCITPAVGTGTVPTGTNPDCLYGEDMCSKGSQCTFGISYGGSSTATAGTITQDQVCLGTLCAPAFVDQLQQQYPAGNLNVGIVGVAFPRNACNPTCQPTLMDSLVAGGALKAEENLFGLCLTGSNGGVLDVGQLVASRYTGTMQYTPVVKEHWYNIVVKDMLIGGTSIGVPQFLWNIVNDGIGGFVDSGTSIVIVSPFAMQQITNIMLSTYGSLPGVNSLFNGQSAFLTSAQVASYPTMDFVVKGMPGQPDFKVSMNGTSYLLNQGFSYSLGIAGIPSIGVVMGDVIMQNYYIAFDRVNARLGFAPIASCS